VWSHCYFHLRLCLGVVFFHYHWRYFFYGYQHHWGTSACFDEGRVSVVYLL